MELAMLETPLGRFFPQLTLPSPNWLTHQHSLAEHTAGALADIWQEEDCLVLCSSKIVVAVPGVWLGSRPGSFLTLAQLVPSWADTTNGLANERCPPRKVLLVVT